MALANPVNKLICRCEENLPPNTVCKKCMGRNCTNLTYKYKEKVYELVPATFLWVGDYYDGPLTGFAVARGYPCFAKTYSDRRDRSFWLYPLTEDEWQFVCYYRANPHRYPKMDTKRGVKNGKLFDLPPTTFLLYQRILASEPIGFFRTSKLPENSPYANHVANLSPTRFLDLRA